MKKMKLRDEDINEIYPITEEEIALEVEHFADEQNRVLYNINSSVNNLVNAFLPLYEKSFTRDDVIEIIKKVHWVANDIKINLHKIGIHD